MKKRSLRPSDEPRGPAVEPPADPRPPLDPHPPEDPEGPAAPEPEPPAPPDWKTITDPPRV